MANRIGLNIDVQFQKQQEVAKNLQSILDYAKKNSTFELDLDMKNVNKSLGDMGKVLAQLKAQLSNFNVLDTVVNTKKINESTIAIEKETQALKEREKVVNGSKVIKESSSNILNNDGTKTTIKELQTIQNEYGEIIQTVDKYDTATGRLKSTIVTTTNEVEKQRLAQEKTLNTLENFKNISQPKIDIAKGNSLIDDSVINQLQSRLNSINTNTASNEMIELKRDIDRLSSGDSGIVRVTNEINKLQNNLNKTKGKYGDLVGAQDTINELKQVENQLLKLKSIQKDMENGTYIDGKKLSSEINQGTDAMRRLETATKNSNDALRISSKDASTFGDAFKDIATKVGLVSIAYSAMNKVTDSFRFGLNSVVEMDGALANLNKVVDLSKSQLNEMRDSAVEMGKALGRSAVEVSNAQSEFGRMYKDLSTINEMTEVAIMGANVMDNTDADQVAKGLTTVMTSMKLETKDAMTILDSMNEVQNNYRVSASDMLDALGKVGSTAQVAGASLQELEGYITSLSVSTGRSGTEVGESLKSITSRIYKIGSEGIEAAGKPEEMLKDMGVAVRDSGGEFRKLDSILKDLSIQWKTMSDTEKIATSQVVAGQNKYNDFLSLLNNFEMATSATATAMDSMSSATKENEIYLNSIEGRMQSLTATSQEFWFNFINSDTIKGSITILQSLMEGFIGLEKTFGGVALSTGLLTTAFLMFTNNPLKAFSKGLLDGTVSTTTLGKSLKTLSTTFTTTKSSMGGLSAVTTTASTGFKMLGASALFAQIKVIALQAALSLGLSLAITAVVGVVTKMGSALFDTSGLMDDVSDSASTLSNSLKEIESGTDLVSQYEELNNKLKDTNNTAEESKSIQTEIANIKNQLSTDEAYYWITASNKGLEEQLELMKQVRDQKIREQAEEVEKNMPSQRKVEKVENSLSSDVKEYNNLVEAMKTVDSQGYLLLNGVQHRASEVQSEIDLLKGKIQENSFAIEEYNGNLSMMEQAGIKNNRTAIEFSEEQNNVRTAINESNASLQESTNKLNENTDAKNSNSSAGSDTTTQAASVEALQKSYESLGYSVEDAKKKVEELNSTNLDGGSVSTASVEDATKAYGESLTKANELQQMVDKINESTTMTGEIVTELASKYPELGAGIFSASESQDFLNNKIAEQADIQSSAMQIMHGNSESYYQAQLANGNSLQSAFDQWASNFIDINSDAYTFDVNNYNNLNEAKVGAMNQLGAACASWLASFTGGNAQGYAHDLSQFTSLAEQKAYVLDQLNKEISKIQNNYNALITEANAAIANSNSAFSGNDLREEQMYARKLDSMKNKLNTLNGAYEQVNTSFSQFNKSFSGVGGSFATPTFDNGSSKKDSGAKEEKEKEIADVEELSDRYYDLNNALTKVENSLTDLHTEMENADDEKKMQLLKEEVKLLNDKKIALENLRNEQQKQLAEDRRTLSNGGFSFGNDGSITNAKSRLDTLTARANSLTGEDKENAIAEVKLLASIVKSYTDMLLDTIPQITDDINDMKNETISAQKEIADIVAKQRDEYIKGLEKETGKLKDELDKRKELMNKSWEDEDREDSLAEKQTQLNDLEEQLALAMRTADEELIKSIRQQITEAQNEVDTFIRDNERDDANDRFDKESEKLDEDLQNKIDKITLQLSDEEILKMVQSGVTDLSKVLNDITSSTSGMTSTFAGIGKIIEGNWIGSLNTFMSGLDSMKNFAMNMSFTPSAVNFDGMGSKAVTVSTGDLIIQGNVAEDILPKLNKMFEANNKQIIKTINDAMKN